MRRPPVCLLILGFGLLLLACGPGHTQVSGFVSDSDLKPLVTAQVEFITPDANLFHPRRSDVSPKGTFHIDPGQNRLFGLNFAAAYCEPQSVMIYLPKPGPLKLDVRLKLYSWVDDYKDVRVIGDFNGFSRDAGAVPFQRLSDGTYFADVQNTIDGKMGYRLIGLVRDNPISVPGTHYDELVVDKDGGFVSRLAVKPGRIRILFDPALLPRATGKAEIIFDHPDSKTARVAAVYGGFAKRSEDYNLAASTFTAAGHDFKDFRYDWTGDVAKLKKELGQEKDDAVRQALWIALLDLARLGSSEVDRSTAQKALAAVPPDSELWQIAGQFLLFDSIRLAGGLDQYRDYFEKVITQNPSRLVRAFALERAYLIARREKNLAKARQYYAMLTGSYGDLIPGQRVKGMPPETSFSLGQPMPSFALESLDDPKITFTQDTFKGKPYFIDFWATWCPPCVGELGNLSALYSKYGPKGLEVLSVSFDNKRDDVRRFRSEKWPMPWRHAFLGKDELKPESKSWDYFELIEGIPHGILVDADGKIVAVGDEARGEKLAANVAGILR